MRDRRGVGMRRDGTQKCRRGSGGEKSNRREEERRRADSGAQGSVRVQTQCDGVGSGSARCGGKEVRRR